MHSTLVDARCLPVNSKFFYAEVRFTVTELSRNRQYSDEDLDVYVSRFHKKALNCCGSVNVEMVVNVCLHGITEEYRENPVLPLFL